MPGRRIRSAIADPGTQWTRRKLQALLVCGVVAGLLMAGGVVGSVIATFDGADPKPTTGSVSNPEDQLAARPLPTARLEAAQPGTSSLSTEQAGTIRLPLPMRVGEAGVATGFPQTPEGALAQLAAIDATALSSTSISTAQAVIDAWAAPSGPTPESWSGVKAVAQLLESAGLSSDGAGSLTVSVDASMGFIKGTVGEAYVVPCIDFIVTATLATGQPQRVAVADCQRMIWQTDRWVIGPGTEPAVAPSLWPGTQASFDAGYQWLEVPQQ